MKKVISILAVLLIVASTSIAAFAHGGCHGGYGRGYGRGYGGAWQQLHAVCEVEGCELVGRHMHDGSWYCGQIGDQAYAACPVEGCAQYGIHRHGGAHYYCAHYGSATSK